MICKACGKKLSIKNISGYCRACYCRSSEGRKKNSEGIKKAHQENRLRIFSSEDRRKAQTNQNKSIYQRFLENPAKNYKSEVLRSNLIYSGRELKCEECIIGEEYNGHPIVLEIHHKDGDHSNNKLDNLQFLCPNCHSQTSNYRNKKRMPL